MAVAGDDRHEIGEVIPVIESLDSQMFSKFVGLRRHEEATQASRLLFFQIRRGDAGVRVTARIP
jgi:hypothetical protein